MKKSAILILCILIVLSFCSCKKNTSIDDSSSEMYSNESMSYSETDKSTETSGNADSTDTGVAGTDTDGQENTTAAGGSVNASANNDDGNNQTDTRYSAQPETSVQTQQATSAPTQSTQPSISTTTTPSTELPVSSVDFTVMELYNSTPQNSKHDHSDMEQYMLELINNARAEIGAAPLKWNETLYPCAEKRAHEIDVLMSHTRPNNTAYDTIFSDFGIVLPPKYSCGENIYRLNDVTEEELNAEGYRRSLTEGSFKAFMNSAGHRANILSGNFSSISLKLTVVNKNFYVVQEFWG